MKNLETEVLIYLNQIKSFLEKNEEARNYFIQDLSIEEFYEKVKTLSQKNFESSGQPQLTQEQFELLRNTKTKKEFEPIIYTKFGGYSLN